MASLFFTNPESCVNFHTPSLSSCRDDFSSLVLEEKPNLVKSLPSVQPPMITEPSILTPTPVHVSHNPHTHSPSKRGKAKGTLSQGGGSSDTDPEAPVAQQMLSFVMDDPDFESEEDLVQKDKKVRDNLRKT